MKRNGRAPGTWMRFVFLAFLGIFLIQCSKREKEEQVHIPDESFLGRLMAAGIDANGDGSISYTEAEAVRSLLIPPSGITDLTGLEAFVNLESLSITLNPLQGIDLRSNRALRYLSCASCELTGLDVSGNPEMEELICGRNEISELDLQHNVSLVSLVCNNNLLTELQITSNALLTRLIACGNRLTSLDISHNTALQVVGIDNMPMLREVCVWTLPFPPEGVTTLQEFSPNVEYTDQCGNPDAGWQGSATRTSLLLNRQGR